MNGIYYIRMVWRTLGEWICNICVSQSVDRIQHIDWLIEFVLARTQNTAEIGFIVACSYCPPGFFLPVEVSRRVTIL